MIFFVNEKPQSIFCGGAVMKNRKNEWLLINKVHLNYYILLPTTYHKIELNKMKYICIRKLIWLLSSGVKKYENEIFKSKGVDTF